MKIVKLKSIGVKRTFSPEMAGRNHNYVTEHSKAIHKNSHAVAYCLVAHRCLWLKAHYPCEWWAAVMSDCHPDKLIRYMNVARGDGVRFDTLDINNLTVKFTVSGDVVNQGLIGVKKIGKKAAEALEGEHQYKNIDDFVCDKGKNKTVIERLIKLGAFKRLENHENSYALWQWYQYKYCSGKDITSLRKRIKEALINKQGWTEDKIAEERQRQIREFRKLYPRKTSVPATIKNWSPKVNDGRAEVMALFQNDFTIKELLDFEKEYLGYYLHSPLDQYAVHGNGTIADAKRGNDPTADKNLDLSFVEVVIDRFELGTTKTNARFGKLFVTDGIQQALIFVWDKQLGEIEKKDAKLKVTTLRAGAGIFAFVKYDRKRNSFALADGKTVRLLKLRACHATPDQGWNKV